MKLSKAEKALLKRLASRGGLATQEKLTFEQKQLQSQRLHAAKRAKRARQLTGGAARVTISTSKNQ